MKCCPPTARWKTSANIPPVLQPLFRDRDVVSLRLNIAGVRISISASFPISPHPFPPEYSTFRDATNAPLGGVDFSVLLTDGIPPASQWGTLVTVAAPWRLFRDGLIRRLVWDGNDPQDPLWLAEFVPDSTVVTVKCGPRLLTHLEGAITIQNPFHYPLDQLLMMYQFVGRGQGIVHSAGLVMRRRCVVAAGRSGAGKSTLSRLWAARHGEGSLLSDDRVILGRSSNVGAVPDAYGSPWPGELGAALNERCSVSALVFLSKARVNRLVAITSREAMERLFPLTSIPWFDAEYLDLALTNVERWVEGIPVYEFQFAPDEGAVSTLETLFAVSAP